MKLVSLAGVASAALALAVQAPLPASAADLGGYGGSIKDGYAQPLPVIQQGSAGPCYFRGDVGYSWSNTPTVKWPVNNQNTTTDYTATAPYSPTNPFVSSSSTFVTDQVSNATMQNTWLAETGVGCGWGGSRGIRVEAVLGYHGSRNITGEPGNFSNTTTQIGTAPSGNAPGTTGWTGGPVDPLHTSVTTYTAMVNAYKDLGNYRGFVPYVGAGIGIAYNRLGDVSFTNNQYLTNSIRGNNDISLAWALMAGVGYQISDRAIIDVGYRYIDMGQISSQRSDTGGFVDPAVKIKDLTANEIKIGLRYYFGGGGNDCCQAEHQSFK